MTALDPELSEEALAVKVRWFEKILERLLTLQSYSVWPSFRHCAVSNFMPSTFLLSKLERPMLHRLFLQSYLYQCQLCLLLLRHFLLQGRTGQWGKIRRISNNFGNSASKKHGTGENCCTKKSLWTLLMTTKRTTDRDWQQAAMATMQTVWRPRLPAAALLPMPLSSC